MQTILLNRNSKYYLPAIGIFLLSACATKLKETKDSVYSRHLQKHIDLTIISTPVPKEKNSFNLLLLNDGQDIEKLRVKKITDSLYNKNVLQPLLIVAINPPDRLQEYGVAGYADHQNNGASAEKYAAFIDDELYPFIKKRAGVRKFNSITIAGWSLGGLSALDIAWDHADKIDKVGVFSGAFSFTDKGNPASNDPDDNGRIIFNKIRSSRKKPHLTYWFYAGGDREAADGKKDGSNDALDDTRDLVELIKKKNVSAPQDIIYTEIKEGKQDYNSWSTVFPAFLIWADGK